MQGRDVDDAVITAERKMQVVDVEMNDVEVLFFSENMLQHQDMVGELVFAVRVQAQGFRAHGNELGAGHRVTAGKEGYLVTSSN